MRFYYARCRSVSEKWGGAYHGYSKTNEKHIQEIFQRLSFEGAGLLDVGCGKGVVLKEAVKFPFEKVAGIEIRHELVQIAKSNFKILGIADMVKCMEADAVEFEQYGEYNVFFFFNPFSEEIMKKVVDKIIKSRNETERIITVIYHNPRFLSVFENRLQVLSKEILYDALKDYDTCILKLKL
ncbi:MAG: methyltransferase domain-containing protein [Candidatus Fimousia sp.]